MGTVTFSDPELTPRVLGQLYLILLLVLLRLKCYFEAEFLDVPSTLLLTHLLPAPTALARPYSHQMVIGKRFHV